MNLWIIFFIIIFWLLGLDLFVFNKKVHEIKMKEAIKWTAMWIAVALVFNTGVWYFMGAEKAGLFLTSYIIEKSLSVDNLFVFIVIFGFFKVDSKYHHKVLYWGILGALITRGLFIGAGLAIINQFHFILYILGAYLLYIAYNLIAKKDDDEVNPDDNFIIKFVKKHTPIQNIFFTVDITPLFIVLIAIEVTDIAFAFDSVPAVMSITTDTFIAYTSNIFAILGLRALYFVIADIMPMFTYLKYGLAVVIGFIGVKLLATNYVTVPTIISLLIVLSILGISIIISILHRRNEQKNALHEAVAITATAIVEKQLQEGELEQRETGNVGGQNGE